MEMVRRKKIFHIRLRFSDMILFSIVLLLSVSCYSDSNGIYPGVIRCNFKTDPLGIEQPLTFSWELTSFSRNQFQTACRIILSDNQDDCENTVGNIWDSGRMNTNESIITLDTLAELRAGKKYFWRVKTWDIHGKGSAWSKTGTFVTALFTSADWDRAQWISFEMMDDSLRLVPGIVTWGHNTTGLATRRAINPLFRKEFTAHKKIRSAYLFVSGLGHYVAYLNGSEVNNSHMVPGWTDYDHTCLYNTYEITNRINKGENAIGILVGTGFYNINNERYRKLLITYGMPKVIAKILINYTDDTSETIVTDNSWKASPSPVTYSSIYGGENYDARLEQKGWNKTGFDDANWPYALSAKRPKGELKAEKAYPVRVQESFSPLKVIKKAVDTFAFDFGQNAAAILTISLKGKKGDTVRIYPSELLFEELRENQRWTGWPHYYEYILKGEGIETWSPMFTYYGLRYAHVTGAQPSEYKTDDQIPELLDLTMHHISNSSPAAGSFWCSNQLFNQIDTLIRYAIRSNLQSVVTDCPHRERLGWIEQTYLMGNSIKFNYDVYHLYSKLVNDMIDGQEENGLVPNFVPEYLYFGGAFTDSPEWGSAIIQVPWLMYKWYGDRSIIEKTWESMLQYIRYLDSTAKDNIISYGLGDWYDVGPELPGFPQLSPIATTATAIYFKNYQVLAQMAKVQDMDELAGKFNAKAIAIRKAYNDLLFDADRAVYATGSQSAMAIPLSMGIVEQQYREKVFNNLVKTIINDEKRITSGDIGFHFLIDALAKGNQSELLYEMNNRDDVPGYGYQIRKGATALTESWEALERKSNNHLMLGHIMEWFYTGLGGIQQKKNSAAYRHLVINPTVIKDLEEVRTSHQVPYGTVVSEWKNTDRELIMHVEIPVNTSAEVYIHSSAGDVIQERGQLVVQHPDIEILEKTASYTKVKVGCGQYDFKVTKTK